MNFKRIIPCLDMKDGRVVKGVNFVNLKDVGDPAEIAVRYQQEGADELVFLDITATQENRGTLVDVVKRTAAGISIPFGVGGGIRNLEDIRILIQAGADKVAISSAAIRNPSFLSDAVREFGSEKIVANIDPKRIVKNGRIEWEIYISGGQIPTGLDPVAWAKESEQRGASEIILTSMDGDGTKEGYDLMVTRRVSDAVKIPVVASGGAGNPEQMADAILLGGADGALAASIFHFGLFTIKQVRDCMKTRGIRLRDI